MKAGKRIRKKLEEKKMSQKELAEKVGVTEVSMSRYLNGERVMSSYVLARMAKALDVTMEYIMLGENMAKSYEQLQDKREQEYDTPYNGAIKKKSIRHKKYVEQMKGENKTMEEIKVNDNVNHSSHYEGHTSIDCIDNMRLIFGNQRVAEFCMLNAYRYLSRHEYKNGLEDLKKAKWYLDYVECMNMIYDDVSIDFKYVDGLNELRKKYEKKYEVNK